MKDDEGKPIEEGAAGAPEGAVSEPSADDIQGMYDELGIKSPAPTSKPKERPKTAAVRAKDVPKDGARDSDAGSKKDDDDKGKSKDAPASDDDGDSGNKADPKGEKKREDAGKVPDESKEADGGVRDAKSRGEGDAERDGEGSSKQGDDGAGQETHEPSGSEEEGKDDEEGKRPGKSNPAVEQRFQKLTDESRAKDAKIEELQKQIDENNQKQREAEIAEKDPQYTVEDFKKVRDNSTGEIRELSDDEAELAHRRWKDGYDQRQAERDAQANHEKAIEQYKAEASEKMMKSSVEAYDALVELYETTPELDANNKEKFDPDFAAIVMPLIHDMVTYQEGTEPSEENREKGIKPVILGVKMNPKKIVDAMKKIQQSKRDLPLNGTSDTVESASDKKVEHGRSSDSMINAANDMYRDLGIKKRL